MKKINIKTITYSVGNGFLVDVQIDKNSIEAYIWHKEFGIKMLMFGVTDESLDYFLKMVEANLSQDIGIYIDEYMSQELQFGDKNVRELKEHYCFDDDENDDDDNDDDDEYFEF